jgi:hypothetical protein
MVPVPGHDVMDALAPMHPVARTDRDPAIAVARYFALGLVGSVHLPLQVPRPS